MLLFTKEFNSLNIGGGSYSGKSEVGHMIRMQYPRDVIAIKEVATALLATVWPFPGRDVDWSEEWQTLFQTAVLGVQRPLEKVWAIALKQQGRKLLLKDRATPDGGTFTPGGQAAFCRRFGLVAEEILAETDVHIHMQSMSAYDPDAYERLMRENSKETFEGLKRAQWVCKSAWKAWQGHPLRLFIPGTEDFGEKTAIVIRVVRCILQKDADGLRQLLDRYSQAPTEYEDFDPDEPAPA